METQLGSEPSKQRDNAAAYGAHSLHNVRKMHIERVLQAVHYDIHKAAGILRITPARLRYWIHRLGVRTDG